WRGIGLAGHRPGATGHRRGCPARGRTRLVAATLGRTAAVVRLRGDVLDGRDLEAGGGQRADRGVTAGARTLDEDVDLGHAGLLRLAGSGFGGHLRGVGGRLAGALEAHLAGRRPRHHGTRGVRDGHDRVVERRLDVRLTVRDGLLDLLARLANGCGHGLLLLSGDGLLGALAGAGVGLGALSADGHATAVPQTLVVADLDLAADVGGHLAAQVALDGEVRLDVVTQRDELLVRRVLHAEVRAHAGRGERLLRAGAADAVDVRESHFHALLARKVDSYKSCHVFLLQW